MGTDTGFDSGTFDEVVCNSCFSHFADKEKAAREMFRLLKPGGRAIVCYGMSRKDLNALHRRLGGVFENDYLPSRAGMYRLYTEAGFVEIEISEGLDSYLMTARVPVRQHHLQPAVYAASLPA